MCITIEKFFFCFLFVISLVDGSYRYDVELESSKLFGEDIRTVLHTFRRTPDYMKILEREKDELDEQNEAKFGSVFGIYELRLCEKIKEMLNASVNEAEGNSTANDVTVPGHKPSLSVPPKRGFLRGYYTTKSSYYYKDDDRDFHDLSRVQRRQLESDYLRHKNGTRTTTTLSPRELLDGIEIYKSEMTLADRMTFSDLGFEYASKMVKAFINHMDGDHEYDDDFEPTTTTNVTQTSTTNATTRKQLVSVTIG